MGVRYTFGRSEFDARRGLLTVDGEACALRPRTAAVLEALLRRPGALMSREELMRAVWPGRVVTPNSIEQCMSELRRGLNGASGTTLRTVPRRGYLLEAQVRIAEAGPVRRSAGVRSLAVLPLKADRAGAMRFAAALAVDLAAELARAPCTTVVSPSTVASLAGDVRRIGRDLGVGYVVEGSAWREGGEWHAGISAAETEGARQVWIERFHHRGSAADSRREIATRVASLLSRELTALESRSPPVESVRDPLEMTRRAYYLMEHALPGMSADALALAQEAREADARAAGPWAAIAHWHLASLAVRAAADRERAIVQAEAAARRAIGLDPAHRLAHAALGGACLYAGRLEEALVALGRQMQLNPNLAGAHHLLGRAHLLRGEPEAALEPLERALALAPRDPRSSTFMASLALALLHLGDDHRALEVAQRAITQPPPWPRSFETLAMALVVSGRPDEARAAVQELLRHWSGYSIAQHRAELAGCSARFQARHGRLVRALALAGLH